MAQTHSVVKAGAPDARLAVAVDNSETMTVDLLHRDRKGVSMPHVVIEGLFCPECKSEQIDRSACCEMHLGRHRSAKHGVIPKSEALMTKPRLSVVPSDDDSQKREEARIKVTDFVKEIRRLWRAEDEYLGRIAFLDDELRQLKNANNELHREVSKLDKENAGLKGKVLDLREQLQQSMRSTKSKNSMYVPLEDRLSHEEIQRLMGARK